jgi:hypothetical protein
MARYFFHIFNDEITRDEEGTDLADDIAAIERAKREAQNLASVSVQEHAHLILHHRIDVTDETARLVGSVTFGDVINISE